MEILEEDLKDRMGMELVLSEPKGSEWWASSCQVPISASLSVYCPPAPPQEAGACRLLEGFLPG